LSGRCARSASASGSASSPARIDAIIRAAALPVGAARRITGGGEPAASAASSSRRMSRSTV
jgi:hypothetical protein